MEEEISQFEPWNDALKGTVASIQIPVRVRCISAFLSREVIENMVARDGVEPPTPAFSGLASPIAINLDYKYLPSESPSETDHLKEKRHTIRRKD